jgi:hypothetical protein
MEHYKERDSKNTDNVTSFNLTVNGEKLKDITNVASVFSNFFITITGKVKH